MNLEVKPPVTHVFLLLEPAFKLFGSVSGSIIKDKDHGVHVTTQCFRDDLLSHKGLEVNKAFARPPCPVYLPIGDRESSKQMSCAATMVTRFMQHRLSRLKRARWLLALAGLNGGFLIETEQPDALAQKGLSLTIGVQDRASALQEGDRIVNMLPGMIAPGAKTFGLQPATHGTGRDVSKSRVSGYASSQFSPAPTRERNLFLLGQATRDGGDLHAHLRGKNASALHCEARQQADGF